MEKHDQRLLIALVIIHVMRELYSLYVINVFTDSTLHRNMPDA